MLITNPSELEFTYSHNRKWQGIPGIERTPGGRMFITFYSGGITEQLGNYCVILMSDDDGATWSEPIAAAYAGEEHRCYDPVLWIDPNGRLWFIWAEAPDSRIAAAVCDEPDASSLHWSEARTIGHNVMMNKPTVLSDGSWLFPMAIWRFGLGIANTDTRWSEDERLAYAVRTADEGKTFERLGGVNAPERCFDEHMLLELGDGRIMMLIRTNYGIGVSYSADRGLSWSEAVDSGLGGPNSRFHIRQLPSGNVLLVNHVNFTGRNNLTVMISRNDCRSWEGYLMIDERASVSYPDSAFGADGSIYIVYDRERGCSWGGNNADNDAREILFAKITEEDILSGKLVSHGSSLRNIASKLVIQ